MVEVVNVMYPVMFEFTYWGKNRISKTLNFFSFYLYAYGGQRIRCRGWFSFFIRQILGIKPWQPGYPYPPSHLSGPCLMCSSYQHSTESEAGIVTKAYAVNIESFLQLSHILLMFTFSKLLSLRTFLALNCPG